MLPPLAAVAHELRTPLDGMTALLALLASTPLDDEQRAHVAALAEAAAGMQRLVDDALRLARLDAGARPPDPAPCDVRDVVAGVARTLGARAAAKALAFETAVDDAVPPALALDGGLLRQIALNLAGNAVKHTWRGTVRVHAAWRAADDDGGGTLRLTVADTGPGLTEAQRARLFRAWERAGADDAVEGVGLGLYLARACVERLGGTIGAEGEHGRGAAFVVEIPVRRLRNGGF